MVCFQVHRLYNNKQDEKVTMNKKQILILYETIVAYL
jgi:hypothetical protein